MTPEEELEFYTQHRVYHERVRLDREYSEWDKLLDVFMKGSAYKNTKGIPTDNLEPNLIYDPSYATGPIDPEFDEYWNMMMQS